MDGAPTIRSSWRRPRAALASRGPARRRLATSAIPSPSVRVLAAGDAARAGVPRAARLQGDIGRADRADGRRSAPARDMGAPGQGVVGAACALLGLARAVQAVRARRLGERRSADERARRRVDRGGGVAGSMARASGSGCFRWIGAWREDWVPPRTRPVELLDEPRGVIDERTLIVHGCSSTRESLARVRARGATIVTCPRSNSVGRCWRSAGGTLLRGRGAGRDWNRQPGQRRRPEPVRGAEGDALAGAANGAGAAPARERHPGRGARAGPRGRSGIVDAGQTRRDRCRRLPPASRTWRNTWSRACLRDQMAQSAIISRRAEEHRNRNQTRNRALCTRNPMRKLIPPICRSSGSATRCFALPFALTGALLATREHPITWAQVGWIVSGMVSARSAAMGFNRLVDARFDALNPRTAARELPRGVMTSVKPRSS